MKSQASEAGISALHSPFVVRHATLLGSALLALAVLLVYLPVYRAGFIWDDDQVLTANPFIQSPTGLKAIWASTEFHDFFPITYSMFWVEWRLWGMNATGYHFVNVLLHALGTVLLWWVLRRLRIPGAWLAALIFGVHPVCVASVAWISERKNTLSLVFYLLSILWYLRSEVEWRVTRHASRVNKWYWFSLFAFLLALLSKTSVVVLPIVLWLCAWWQRARGSASAASPTHPLTDSPGHLFRDLLRLVPFFALALILGLVTVWFQLYQPRGTDIGYGSDPMLVRLIAGSWAVWFYLGKALLPVQLSMIYPRWEVDPASVLSYVPGVLWLAGLFWCWRHRAGWGRAVFFGLGYFWVALWPVSGFFDMRFLSHTRAADHWQYLALIGVIALVVGVAARQVGNLAGEKVRKWESGKVGKWAFSHFPTFSPAHFLPVCPAAVIVLSLCVLTWQQARLYANPEQLWRQALAVNPRSASVWIALGVVVDSQGRFAEAEGYYRESIRLRADIPVAQNNLGYVLLNLRRLDEAVPYFQAALRLKPDFAEPYYNLGIVAYLQDRLAEAIDHLQTAIRLKPHMSGPYKFLGIVLAKQGKFDQAENYFRLALQYRSEPADIYANLGKLCMAQGRIDDAVEHYREALRLRYDAPDALNNLAWIMATHRDPQYRNGPEAVRLAELASRMARHEDAGTLDTLAAAYAEMGRFEEAARAARRALELAEAADDKELSDALTKRISEYEAGKPHRE